MIYFARWKLVLIGVICALALAYAAPNFLSRTMTDEVDLPAWIPHQQVSLGLDLQGGSHLLLEVQSHVLLREYMESVLEGVRADLRVMRVRYQDLTLSGDPIPTVSVAIRNAADMQKAQAQLRPPEGIEMTPDGTRFLFTMNEQEQKRQQLSALQQSIEIIRRRVDETGVREPTIQRQGDERIIVQLPGIDDPERIKRLLGKTAKLTFHLVDGRGARILADGRAIPAGTMALPSTDTGGKVLIKKRVMLGGETLMDAEPAFDARTNEPVVNFRFNTQGARRFGEVTTQNVGKPFAIVLDGQVISAPVIREPILGGSGQISGSFSVEAARDLALLLRAGALPAPLVILEERTVGPGLGADSIEKGKFAAVIGLILVIAFMTIRYRMMGIFANMALMINMVLILGVLSALQATLTLPGIAGIVLTIGMAVDANVLIFERIREELRTGRSIMGAIDAGYSRAMMTIVDANVTTLIAAVLLYVLGSGPVKGFAVTLSVGIATSVFSAITLTRLMVVVWVRRRHITALPL